jgi:hypothetical protein
MPIPMPPRALPTAYRVIYMRAIRALACSNSKIEYRFLIRGSKKYAYYILINKKYYLVPLYIG